jgi:hypothetical protein
MIQDGLYSRFAKHVETVCLENPRRFQSCATCAGETNQILYSPTRVMFRDAVNQGLYDPISELREQLG